MCYSKAKRRNINALPVIFRRWRYTEFKGVIEAVLPTLPAKPGYVATYARVGQHSEGSLDWMYSKTRPATPEEYGPLLVELGAIYGMDPDAFELIVVKKITPNMDQERRENSAP